MNPQNFNSSLPVRLPECAAIMSNINKHIRYMHATLGYLRDQLQADPKILQLGQEIHTVSSLASQCGDALKHLRGFNEEVKFLKCHLDKVIILNCFSSSLCGKLQIVFYNYDTCHRKAR